MLPFTHYIVRFGYLTCVWCSWNHQIVFEKLIRLASVRVEVFKLLPFRIEIRVYVETVKSHSTSIRMKRGIDARRDCYAELQVIEASLIIYIQMLGSMWLLSACARRSSQSHPPVKVCCYCFMFTLDMILLRAYGFSGIFVVSFPMNKLLLCLFLLLGEEKNSHSGISTLLHLSKDNWVLFVCLQLILIGSNMTPRNTTHN